MMTRCRLYIYMLFFLAITINDVFSQTAIAVKGRVRSQEGAPLAGASISQKNGQAAATSDKEGFFAINVPGGATLIFTHVGYEPKEMVASGNLQVTLSPQAIKLEEVEIVVDKGYGKSRRIAVSSSIASVSGKDILNQPAYNVGTLLQGKATGVQVTNTSGGYPKILIRGFTTLNTSTDPLVIMDGINLGRANLNLVNVNDIETIDILKDGAAAAIYGSDASGGVIVITTKKGKAGKLQTDLNVNYGREFYKDPKLADANEYTEVQKRRFSNYTTPSWATSTDWWNTVIKPTNVVNANVGMSGGTDKLTSYASVGFYRTEGPFYNGFTQRATARVNLDYKPNNYIKAGTTLYPDLKTGKIQGSVATSCL